MRYVYDLMTRMIRWMRFTKCSGVRAKRQKKQYGPNDSVKKRLGWVLFGIIRHFLAYFRRILLAEATSLLASASPSRLPIHQVSHLHSQPSSAPSARSVAPAVLRCYSHGCRRAGSIALDVFYVGALRSGGWMQGESQATM